MPAWESEERDEQGRFAGGGSDPAVIKDYTQSGMAANRLLREGSLPTTYGPSETPEAEQLIARTDAAIASSPGLAEDTVLYRGVSDVASEKAPDYSEIAPGTRIVEPAFTSTSTDPSKSMDGIFRGQSLEIHAPAGTPVLDTKNIYDEIVLPRGSEYEVASQEADRTILNLIPQ
jgi:hypothetical protein